MIAKEDRQPVDIVERSKIWRQESQIAVVKARSLQKRLRVGFLVCPESANPASHATM